MKIAVCVKQVPSVNEQRLDPVTGTVIREGVESILNPFDAHAVEEALRLKARAGGSIVAISMGVPSAENTLRRVISAGVDEAVLLTDRLFAGSDTLATARALALGIRRFGMPDLILCGKMATDGDTAQVGPMLAEMLHLPHVTDISRIDVLSKRGIEVTRMTDDGYQKVCAPLPVLLTVVKEINVPRLPSVSGVLRAKAARVHVWSAADVDAAAEQVGLRGSATRVVRTARPEKRAACRMLTSASELMEILQKGGHAR